MNPSETAELMENIRTIRDTFQIAVLLIEHDMNLVMNICEGICRAELRQASSPRARPEDIQSNPAGHRGLPRQEEGGVTMAQMLES